MKFTKQAEIAERLSNLFRDPRLIARGTAGAVVAPLVPWSSLSALGHDLSGSSRKDENVQGVFTDAGRMIGTCMGAVGGHGLYKGWLPKGSPMLQAAMMLGGAGVGATLGHMKGKSIGQHFFPGTLSDRIHRTLNNF